MDKFVTKTTRKRSSTLVSSEDRPKRKCIFEKLSAKNFDCDFGLLYSSSEAKSLLEKCEEDLSYFTGQLSKVFVFGKWHQIPRKQVAFGDEGLTYKYSNNVVAARPWVPLLSGIKHDIERATGMEFNFVLINRYADGQDHMGEHKDDEEELVSGSSIASLSLGQTRDFHFRHQDQRRGAKPAKDPPSPIKLKLESGSLLLMNSPTNDFWYHSLPKRSVKTAPHLRINMTFRHMIFVQR